jgi:hypothetical protein
MAPRNKWFGWWYVCIGIGFVLLAIRSMLARVPMISTGLRFIIALGFLFLGFATLRSVKAK